MISFLPSFIKSEEIDLSSKDGQLTQFKENESILEIKELSLIGSSTLEKNKEKKSFKGVTFVGLDIPGDAQILANRLSAFFHDKSFTQDIINQIKKEIIFYYRENKHPLVAVSVPEQEITDGVLKIKVVEGKLGKIKVKGNRYAKSDQITKWIKLKSGDSINEKKLLQDLSWINSNPFRNVSITYVPGEEYGSTDLWLNVEDRRPVRLYAGGDNTGSQFTGQTRWFAGVNFANFFYPDNLLSYQYTTANSLKVFQSHTGQFILPLPWRHTLNVFGAYATVEPKITGFTSKGKSYQASGRYDMPLWFAYPSWQQTVTLGFDFKGTNNNLIFGSDVEIAEGSLVNIAQFILSYHLGVEPGYQKISTGIDFFWSPGEMISHQSLSDFHTLNPKASAKYFYARFVYAHEVNIYRNFSLFGSCQLQLSNSNLLPSEQLALGGYSTVRGYPERVVNGDNGLCLNFEARSPHYSPLKKITKDDLYLLAFIDFGYAWDHSKVPGLPLTQTLLGIGPGLRYRISSYFNMRFDLGFPLSKVENASKNPRVHLSAILSY